MNDPLELPLGYLAEARQMQKLLSLASGPWWSDLPPAAAMTMISRDGKEVARVGFLLREWMLALAKAWESLEACAQLWPNLTESADGQKRSLITDFSRPRFSCRTDGKEIEMDVDFGYIRQTVVEFLRRTDEIADPPTTPDEAFQRLCDYRDCRLLFADVADGSHLALNANVSAYTSLSIAHSKFGMVELHAYVRKYRAANLLYSWLSFSHPERPAAEREACINRYQFLFSDLEKPNRHFMSAGRFVLAHQDYDFGGGLTPDYRDNLQCVLRRLWEGARQTYYDDLINLISVPAMNSGPASALGNIAPVAIIPGAHAAPSEVLVAFAKGSATDSKDGLPATLRDLHAALTTHEFAKIVKAVVLVTDCWDSQLFSTIGCPHSKVGIPFYVIMVGTPGIFPAVMTHGVNLIVSANSETPRS